MALMEKRRYQGKRYQRRRDRRQVYRKRRRRTGFYVFVGLVVLTLAGMILFGTDLMLQPDRGVVERVEEPTVSEAPETTSGEEATEEDRGTEEEEAAPTPPDDPTMRLTVPKLGIYDALVIDDISEDGGLTLGVGHVPGTGFPWQKQANTYIAGHRLGYPGTASDHIFFNLHALEEGDDIILEDSNGQVYKYKVSEILQVPPTDLSVMDPVGGRDMVSLQTCIENFDDFETLGPDWNVRLIVRGDRV